MYRSRCLLGGLVILMLVALLPGVIPAHAQGPEETIEELALRAHLQNLRTFSYTDWIGGPLGDPLYAPAQSLAGPKLENWTLEGMMGDEAMTQDSLARPVLLNFWASWCVPCQMEFPDVVAIALAPEQYAFDVVFVNVWDTPQDARTYLGVFPDAIHTVLDTADRLATQSGVDAIPTSLLLNTDGTVLVAHSSLMTPTIAAFLSAVAANPGVGSFVAADHAGIQPAAVLAPVAIDAAAPILYGEVATGTITEEDSQHAYSFEGQAGDVVEIKLEAVQSDLDPYLVLMAADGTRLGEHDDIDPGIIRASVINATLPASGQYIIVATRFLEAEGYETGDYRLTLDRASGAEPSAVPAQPAGDHVLTLGVTVFGVLDDARYQEAWTFGGARGEVISLVMGRTIDQPGGLDGYLTLQGPDGATLLEVDDAHESVMPAIEGFTLPADGTYTVTASRFGFANGFSTGEYTLILTKSGTSAAQGIVEGAAQWLPEGELPPGLRRIAYNDPVSGTLSSSHFDDWYLFAGRAGDVITLRMTAVGGDLDPYLILTDAAGYELARNDDDAETSGDAVIGEYMLPVDGRYMIRATRYGFGNGPSSGDYRLIIETEAETVSTSGEQTLLELPAFGEVQTGTLSLDQPNQGYRFEGRAGDVVTISAERTSGDLDLALVLYDPEGEKLASSSGWLTPAETRLNRVSLPAAGTYALDVQLEDFTTAGDYRLIVLAEPPAAVETGAFQPAAGQDIEVVLIWSGTADLDLSAAGPVSDPGPQVTARANDFCAALDPSPVERVTWPEGTAAAGLHTIQVIYRFNCAGQTDPVSFILAVVKNGQVEFVGGTLSRAGDSYSTLLDYAP